MAAAKAARAEAVVVYTEIEKCVLDLYLCSQMLPLMFHMVAIWRRRKKKVVKSYNHHLSAQFQCVLIVFKLR